MFTHEDFFVPALFDTRLCVRCSAPYVEGQTFESYDEAGEEWLCAECWVNEALVQCLNMNMNINVAEMVAEQAKADDVVASVYD